MDEMQSPSESLTPLLGPMMKKKQHISGVIWGTFHEKAALSEDANKSVSFNASPTVMVEMFVA